MPQFSIKSKLTKYHSTVLFFVAVFALIPTTSTAQQADSISSKTISQIKNSVLKNASISPLNKKYNKNSKRLSSLFPRPPIIARNITFWENVYSRYNTNQLIIHDSIHLNRIYTVATMINSKLPGADKINAAREEKLKKKYSNILKKLSSAPPSNTEEIRIAAFFSGKNRHNQMLKAAKNIRAQSGMRQRFHAGVIRSGAWLPQFRKIFRRYNLPEELAYLPHVESSFHSGARSKAGATGMWQFTRSTGKRYLIIDDVVDERLDPITSAEAAAQYFAWSYQQTKNWPMTVTSYNYGLPGSIRALKKYRSYPSIFRYHQSSSFQFASRNFYPEFIAAYNVAQRIENTIKKNNPQKIYTLQLKGYVSLQDIAHYFDLSKKTIMIYNPALHQNVFTGRKRITKGYHLHLPASTKIKQRIASFPQKLYYNSQIKNWIPRKIKIKKRG